MLHLLALLFYRITVNDQNYEHMLNLSHKLPVFLFAFSPYCGHCTAVKPTWKQLEVKYSVNPNIMLASLDCIAFGQLCRQQEVKWYPTFASIIEGKTTVSRPSRSLEGLSSFANGIITNNNANCLRYEQDMDIQAPFVVVYETIEEPTACELIQDLKKQNVDLSLYAGFGKEAGTLRKFTNKTAYEELSSPYTIPMAVKFAQKPQIITQRIPEVKNIKETSENDRNRINKYPYLPVWIIIGALIMILSLMLIVVMMTPTHQYQLPEKAINNMIAPESSSDSEEGNDEVENYQLETQPTDKVEQLKYEEA